MFSSPVATAEFSKFAGILSAALSQHHISGLKVLNWNSITSTSFVCSDASKAYFISHSRMSDSRWMITPLWLLGSCRWWLQQWNWKMLACWKKSYDQPRQHIKNQKHYFATKCPSSQIYGFSSSHEWMWELDYKESWVPNNLCFCSVVLGSLGLQGDATSLS